MVIKILRKVLSVGLVFLLVPLFVLQAQVHGVTALLLDHTMIRDSVKATFRRAGVYSMLAMPISQVLGGASPVLGSISGGVKSIADSLHTVLTPSKLQVLAEATIDGLNGWLFEDKEDILIDISPLRADVSTAVRQSVESFTTQYPACKQQQLSGSLSSLRCRPPAEFIAEKLDAVDFSALRITPGWIFRVTLRWPLHLAAASAKLARFGGWGIVAFLLAILVVLNLDRWHTPLSWLGATGVVGGVMSVALAAFLRALAILTDSESIASILGHLAVAIESRALLASVWLGVSGLLFLVIHAFVRRYDRVYVAARG